MLQSHIPDNIALTHSLRAGDDTAPDDITSTQDRAIGDNHLLH